MLKKLVSISLILAILGTMFQFMVPVSWYIVNYHHITTELCVNRNNPDVDCIGMCQLDKKLNSQHEQHQETTQKMADRNSYRVDFFYSNDLLYSPQAIESLNNLRGGVADIHSSWISEPPCPPPQYV